MRRQDSTKRSLQVLLFASLIPLSGLLLAGEMDTKISNETCLECHDGLSETLAMTPHQLDNMSTEINCVSCHSGASVHIEDPSTENIFNPKNATQADAFSACSSCHIPHAQMDELGYDVHQSAGMNCSSCHTVHNSDHTKKLVDRSSAFCLSCHTDTKANFSKKSAHPVMLDALTCLSCHSFGKKTDDNLAYESNRLCQSCHADQGGPFLFEHAAANSYMTGGSGCVECHNPHGSDQEYMLEQPVNQLCKSCHFTPLHETVHPNRGYQELNCVTCHTDHHGSMVSNKFLDPNLNTKFADNCYQSGCHSLVD